MVCRKEELQREEIIAVKCSSYRVRGQKKQTQLQTCRAWSS